MNHQELIDKAAIKLCPIGIKLITEPNPVEMSRSGYNTVYHHCDIYAGRPSYASCLHVLDHAVEGINEELRPECHRAIANKTCPALAMRKEELKAGHTLFFVDYKALRERRAAEYAKEETKVFYGRSRKSASGKGAKFVPTVFDAKGQPIFDRKVAAEIEIKPAPTTRRTPSKPPAFERVGNSDDNIMQKVLEKALENDQNR